MQTLITKTTRDGRTLVITFDGETFIATIDGVELVRSAQYGHRARVRGEMMHVFGDKVGLTFAEGDTLRTAYTDALRAQPQVVTRESLVATYQGLCDEQAAAYERAHAREDARAMSIRVSYEARIAAALEAIRAYDAAHPAETAARETARQESRERNRWM